MFLSYFENLFATHRNIVATYMKFLPKGRVKILYTIYKLNYSFKLRTLSLKINDFPLIELPIFILNAEHPKKTNVDTRPANCQGNKIVQAKHLFDVFDDLRLNTILVFLYIIFC